MANKIDVIVQRALRTFKNSFRKLQECSLSDLNDLKLLADDINSNDIEKLQGILRPYELKEFLTVKKRTQDYFPVYEDDVITVGVFLLTTGSKLPIHDHPNMYGIIKILEGIVKITSYSLVEVDTSIRTKSTSMFYNHPLKVIKHPAITLSSSDKSCLLTPTDKNIHEVESVEGPAAFLDILSPPYDYGDSGEARSCHYFQELVPEMLHKMDLEDNFTVTDSYLRLIQVPSPF